MAEKKFVVSGIGRNLERFEEFAKLAARLKAYGRVQVSIAGLAGKARHTIPPGGSGWHEYAAFNPPLCYVFPHPKIAPHLPAEWVRKNRELLLAKAAILKRLGLEASYPTNEPHFLPESFFAAHPHLRGPRVDHPRRSRREEFSLCTDLEETQEIYAAMIAELRRQVPFMNTFLFNTNDAGSAFCWAAANYSGTNGPRHCQGRHAGVRVRDFVQALQRGAETAGGPLDVRILHANFWNNESFLVQDSLPPHAYLTARDNTCLATGSLSNENYPVLGLLDPLAILEAVEEYGKPEVQTVLLDFGCHYRRGNENPETVAKVLDVLENGIRKPARGLLQRLDRMRELAASWGAGTRAEATAEAFAKLNLALRLRRMAAPWFSPHYAGVSMRMITRPLLIRPEALTAEEEAYFLPHVLNVRQSEARSDYIDLHGGRIEIGSTAPVALHEARANALAAAQTFEAAASEDAWWKRAALAARIWVSILQSCSNFYFAQKLRDRCRERLSEPHVPEKEGSREGEPGNLEWTELQRSEFDNTNNLIALLQAGGLEVFGRAQASDDEDTFTLGPDIIGALQQKAKIMRQHWCDVEAYLAPPHR